MGNKSSSKPTYTKQQKMLLEWGEQNIIPMAEGKETIMGRQLEQQAMDITDLQRQASTQNIMDVAGTTGMGGSQVAGLLSQSEDAAIQSGFKNIMGAKMSMANKALDMISGVPLAPGQTSKSEEGAASIFAKVAGGVGDLSGGVGDLAKGIGSLTSVSDIDEANV